MKHLTEHLWFEVPQRRGYLNITLTVEGVVAKSAVREGLFWSTLSRFGH